MDEVDIAIIGAGMSGLTAAKEVMASGKSFVVLEARNRIGGRAYTNSEYFGIQFDYGCSWIHSPDINPLRPLVMNSGLEVITDTGYDLFIDKMKATSKQKAVFAEAFDEITNIIKSTKKDIPLSSIMDLTQNPYSKAAAKVLAFIAGLDINEVSTQALIEEVENSGNELVKEGLGNFVNLFGKNLPIQLSSPVTSINYTNKNYIIVTTPRGQIKAKKVILTVPIGVLINEVIKFIPKLPLFKQKAIQSFKMGSFNKIALLFKPNTFQVPKNYYLIMENESRPSIAASMNYLGSGLCIVYVAGNLAQELENNGEKAAIDFGLSSLSDVFGNNIQKEYLKAKATAWTSDTFSYGSYSAPIPGLSNMRSNLSLPIDNRIFFAGEAYHNKWMTHLAGAYLSGIENAKLAINALQNQ